MICMWLAIKPFELPDDSSQDDNHLKKGLGQMTAGGISIQT